MPCWPRRSSRRCRKGRLKRRGGGSSRVRASLSIAVTLRWPLLERPSKDDGDRDKARAYASSADVRGMFDDMSEVTRGVLEPGIAVEIEHVKFPGMVQFRIVSGEIPQAMS